MVFNDMRKTKFVCVFDTLSKQNLCVFQNFLSVNNADTHVIWDSVIPYTDLSHISFLGAQH